MVSFIFKFDQKNELNDFEDNHASGSFKRTQVPMNEWSTLITLKECQKYTIVLPPGKLL
jgi:hypothetical protein